ncbi:MAG: F0F1 ATP synthase subunit B [Candidatus Nomurabacteria bacterium]|nr:MAG: F0F1 ATP synthase subunit B [Candidatus Nomurabacteria bacterium]
MTQPFQQFAASNSGDIFTSLGINGQMLLFQMVAFLILVFVLNKWVFPVLMKTVDDRQEAINAGAKAAAAAEEKAAEAQKEVAKLLKEAREEAKDIVITAKDEATAMIADSEDKAKKRAEKIVTDAHDQLEKDVIAARKVLHNDTIELVALATEKVVGKAVNADVDKKIIAEAVKENS